MITSRSFGKTANGCEVTCYDLTNHKGMVVSVLDYGCTIQRILVPDKFGTLIDVALGYDTIEGYEAGNCFFGAFVGRYANRIRNSEFVLSGKHCSLKPNDGDNHLHGVFSKTMFIPSVKSNTLSLNHISPPEEEGFPGCLKVSVHYTLSDDNALIIDYRAETDAETVVNLTNHTYFNLNGYGSIVNHSLRLSSSCFAECDSQTLPTGRLLSVAGTPMDFRSVRTVGEGMNIAYPQLKLCGGYDHHYVLDHDSIEMKRFAELIGDQSGIHMVAETTQPGVQLYTGNYVQNDSAPFGKGGLRYAQHAGLCLETQHAPDSPNQPQFPSTVLRPGEEYRQTTVYRFYT